MRGWFVFSRRFVSCPVIFTYTFQRITTQSNGLARIMVFRRTDYTLPTTAIFLYSTYLSCHSLLFIRYPRPRVVLMLCGF